MQISGVSGSGQPLDYSNSSLKIGDTFKIEDKQWKVVRMTSKCYIVASDGGMVKTYDKHIIDNALNKKK